MNFLTAVTTCFKKYFQFRGRARRSEYWWFYLFTIILSIIAGIIDVALFGLENADSGPVGIITSLAVLIPSLAVTFRRLHDTNRSGWWIGGPVIAALIAAFLFGVLYGGGILEATEMSGVTLALMIILSIAVLAWAIAILVFMCLDSHHGDNKYGPSPKYGGQAAAFD